MKRKFGFVILTIMILAMSGCSNNSNVQTVDEVERMNNIEENSLSQTTETNEGYEEQSISWTKGDAAIYYDELRQKMERINTEDRNMEILEQLLTFEQFKVYLRTQGVEKLEGFDIELPEISKEQENEIISQAVRCSDMRKNKEGRYELCGSTRRAFLPLLKPYLYIKCIAPDGNICIHYFYDTYISILSTELNGNSSYAIRTPEYYNYNWVYIFYDEIPSAYWFPLEADRRECRYILKNCVTGEETEFIPETGMSNNQVYEKVNSMYEEAFRQSLEIKKGNRQEMIHKSIQNIMDLIDTDLDTAKRIYEDLCWAAWTDVYSVDNYNKDTNEITFSDMEKRNFKGYLNQKNNLWKVLDSEKEILYQGESEDDRTESLADISIRKNEV